jgi:hypothetical protein
LRDPLPVRVSIDALRPDESPEEGARSVCRLPEPGEAPAPWEAWILPSARRVAGQSSSEQVPVYAARAGAVVLAVVSNPTEQPAQVTLAAKVGSGVYSVERLLFEPRTPETPPRLERLESVALSAAGTVRKPGLIPAGHAAVYRFINHSAEAGAAYRRMWSALQSVRAESPSEFRLLMTPLRECQANVGAMFTKLARANGRDKALKHVHRAILTASHGQSLCRNFKRQGRLGEERGGRLEEALSDLQGSLTSLSAGCLNLLPTVTVAPMNPEEPDLRKVTVALTNAGRQTVTGVSLGANPPPGGRVSPADRAVFDALRPRETVTAAFLVRVPDGAAADVTGEIAYVAARVPSRLTVKPL